MRKARTYIPLATVYVNVATSECTVPVVVATQPMACTTAAVVTMYTVSDRLMPLRQAPLPSPWQVGALPSTV